MVNNLTTYNEDYLFGVSFLNDSLTNFTYKLRFSYAPRNLRSKYS
jgi:hypothetical protein